MLQNGHGIVVVQMLGMVCVPEVAGLASLSCWAHTVVTVNAGDYTLFILWVMRSES